MIKSGDPVEQEKQLKYASLVANAIMLSNVADMTAVLSRWPRTGTRHARPWSPASAPTPAGTSCRFGQYALDMGDLPGPLDPQPLPFEVGLVTTFYT